jgi:hypothetical protein
MHMHLFGCAIHLAMYGHCFHASLCIHNKTRPVCRYADEHYDWSDVRLSWKQVTRFQQTWLARNVDYDDKLWKHNVFYGS